MTELQQKAIYQMREEARKANDLLTSLSVKILGNKEQIDVTKDVYPIGDRIRSIESWIAAVISNK